jgi:RNA-directed DNA polymerase
VLARLNPIIRGWSAYYRTVVSSQAFAGLDRYVWTLMYKWAKHGHSNKSRYWIVDRYFGAFNRSRRDRWVFGDRDSGAYLIKFAWTPIVRHQMVKGRASVDDPALAGYWADRRSRSRPPLDKSRLHLLQMQKGRCPLCGSLLLQIDQEPQTPSEWERWLHVFRKAIRKHAITTVTEHGKSDEATARLIHAHCRGRLHADPGGGPQQLLDPEPSGLA